MPRRATPPRPLCPGYVGGPRKCYLTGDGSPCRNHDPVVLEKKREIGKATGWKKRFHEPLPPPEQRREEALQVLRTIMLDEEAAEACRTGAAKAILADVESDGDWGRGRGRGTPLSIPAVTVPPPAPVPTPTLDNLLDDAPVPATTQ